MFGRIARYRAVIVTLTLATIGLALIVAAQTFHKELLKVEIDRIVGEVGTLLLVVGILHWLFEIGLRREMLREISAAVIGSTRLHESGLENCLMNSRLVDDAPHWRNCASLTIGHQYSPRFIKDFYEVLEARAKNQRHTTVTVLDPNSAAAQYVQESINGHPSVGDSVKEIVELLKEIDGGTEKYTDLVLHDRILRYSFIKTDEFIWIKFFTNSAGRTTVPALKVRAGTPFFKFISDDINRLLDGSLENKRTSPPARQNLEDQECGTNTCHAADTPGTQ